jgi:hypothetical protein
MSPVGCREDDRGATPMVARVEWRSESRWAELPVALVLGGERIEIAVAERWVEGPRVAGAETRRCFVVGDERGRRFRVRLSSAGRTTVELLPARRLGGGLDDDDPHGGAEL